MNLVSDSTALVDGKKLLWLVLESLETSGEEQG